MINSLPAHWQLNLLCGWLYRPCRLESAEPTFRPLCIFCFPNALCTLYCIISFCISQDIVTLYIWQSFAIIKMYIYRIKYIQIIQKVVCMSFIDKRFQRREKKHRRNYEIEDKLYTKLERKAISLAIKLTKCRKYKESVLMLENRPCRSW